MNPTDPSMGAVVSTNSITPPSDTLPEALTTLNPTPPHSPAATTAHWAFPSAMGAPAAAPQPQAAAPAPALQRVTRELPECERNAAAYSLDLPSGFVFYPFKALSAKLITARQQAKFTQASQQSSMRIVVEAISSCLGDGVSAKSLTLPDFFYVMYWLRLNSYTNFDFNHVAVCRDPEHHRKVIAKEMAPETLKSLHVLKATTLVEKQLPGIPSLPERVAKYGLVLQPAFMEDVIAVDEMKPKEVDDTEWAYIASIACYISPNQTRPEWQNEGKPLSFADRIRIAEDLPGDLARAITTEWEEKINSYGVEESITVRCGGCGAAVRTEVQISAPDFL